MEKPHRFERLDSSVRIAKRVGSVLRLFDDRAVKLNQQDTNAQIMWRSTHNTPPNLIRAVVKVAVV